MKRMKRKKIAPKLLAALSGLVILFLWLPVIVIIVYSFSANKYGVAWDGFTLKWYGDLIENEAVKDALIRSLVISSVTVVFATLIGTITAYGLFKFHFKGKQFIRTSSLIPIVMPEVVTAAALLVFFTKVMHLPLGYPSIIVSHIIFSTPLAVFVILGRMQRIDWAWEEAAMDLGANRFRAFRRVIGPQLMPAILAAAVMVFPWSFDDFIITYFVSGIGSTTLPIYVYSQMRFGATPVINTIGTLFVVITVGALFLTRTIEKRA